MRLLTSLLLLLLVGGPLAVGGYVLTRRVGAWRHERAARAALERRDFDQAYAEYAACAAAREGDAEAQLQAARAARRAGLYAPAERHLAEALRLGADGAVVRTERQLAQVQQGELGGVDDRLYDQAVRGHADALLILEALARGYMNTYRLGAALRCLDAWLERTPDDVLALTWRAWVHEHLDEVNATLEDYRRAVALDPGNETLRQKLAESLLKAGKAGEALPLFEELHARQPENAAVRLGLARACQRGGRLDEARDLLAGLVAAQPDNAAAWAEQGKLALLEGNPAVAEGALRRAVTLDPGDRGAHFSLAQCLRQLGRADEAQHYQQEEERIAADQRRVQELNEAITAAPHDARLRCEMGRILLRNGRAADAVRWLEGALREDPACRPAHQALAEYYERTGDPARARDHRRLADGPG